MSLTEEYFHVKTTEEKSDRIIAALEKLGVTEKVTFAFLSWMPEREMALFRYIALGFRVKEKLTHMLADDEVRKVNDMANQTGQEKKKWKGFLRFSVMENRVFFAEMSPKNNVLTLIMPHFSRRFRVKPFLIHDQTYRQVGVFDTREWCVVPSEGLIPPDMHSDELKYRHMWKTFYDSTAMAERTNLKQRQQVMPLRYQKHLVELH